MGTQLETAVNWALRMYSRGGWEAVVANRYPDADFWDQQAGTFKSSWQATTPDYYLKVLEHKAMVPWVKAASRVLDLGCGNGYTSAFLARMSRAEIWGLEYSQRLIAQTKPFLESSPRRSLRFVGGDAVALPLRSGTFDVVITCRVLMNIPSFGQQMEAADEIHRVLRRRGLYLCIEETEEGLEALNSVRTGRWGIQPVPPCYRNCLLREREFCCAMEDKFKLVKTVNFASS